MHRINYQAKLDERLDELRRLYNNDSKPGEQTYIGWRKQTGQSYILYKVTNHSGGIRVLRSAGKAGELLDFVEGLIDGTRAARTAAEHTTRDAWTN